MATPLATRTFALLFGFDFQSLHCPGHLAPLRGMVNDAIAWLRLLRSTGVSGRNVALVTDVPVDALAARLEREGVIDPARESDRVLIEQGLFQAHGAADINDAIRAFVDRAIPPANPGLGRLVEAIESAVDGALPSADVALDPFSRLTLRGGAAPGSRLFIAWGGHGTVIDRGGGSYPAVLTPDGDHVTLADLLVRANTAFGTDRRPGDPPRVVAFVGACNTAAALVPLEGTQQTSDTFGVPTLAASVEGRPATEIEVDGVWRGAMAWAATTVMSRFEPRLEGGISLTYGELIHRMRNLLTAIDVPDEPLLFVPTGELNRPILRRAGAEVEALGDRRPEAGSALEIYPVGGYRITRPGSKTEIGMMYVTDRKGRPFPKESDVAFPHADGLYIVARPAATSASQPVEVLLSDDFELTAAGHDAGVLGADVAAAARREPQVLTTIQRPWAAVAPGSATDASHRLDVQYPGSPLWHTQAVYFERRGDALHFFADTASPSTVSVVPLYKRAVRVRFRRFGDTVRPQKLAYRYRAIDVPAT